MVAREDGKMVSDLVHYYHYEYSVLTIHHCQFGTHPQFDSLEVTTCYHNMLRTCSA